MSTDNKDAVAELKRLAEAATPGPWDFDTADTPYKIAGGEVVGGDALPYGDVYTVQEYQTPEGPECLIVATEIGVANGRYIARANPAAILDLIAAHAAQAERIAELEAALVIAEAALGDIGDADREPGDDVAWCESRAAEALPAVRAVMDRPSRPVQQPGNAPATVGMSAIWIEAAKDPAFLAELEQGSAEVNSVLGAPATVDLQAAIMALPRFDTESVEQSRQGEKYYETIFGEDENGDYISRAAAAALVASARPRAAQGMQAEEQAASVVPTRLDVMSLIHSQMHRVYASAIDRDDVDTKYMTENEDAIMGIYHGRYIAGYDLRKSEQPAARELTDADIERLWQSLPGVEIHNQAARKGVDTQYALRIAHARAIAAHLAGNAGAGEKA